MDLTLTRQDNNQNGIFSVLSDSSGNIISHTLEHSYTGEDGSSYIPKIPDGTYTCVRGPHRLNGMTDDFITFEITGVSGHSNLLFHWGNYNRDSEGCVLLGESRVGDMVTNSRITFNKFIDLQKNINEFILVVK